jgi:membrane protein YqaA with SNARE-associated domain
MIIDIISLTLASFAAATILPAQSEVVLSGMLLSGQYNAVLLVAVASAANTLGSCVNWLLGRYIDRFSGSRWFPATPAQMDAARARYGRFGKWSLLLSWVPFIGDPITVIAGVMRENFITFVAITGFAKTSRYVVLAFLILSATS